MHDVTLRDGEQTPGVVFRKSEKLQIAQALDDVGVDRIEAGMPVVSQEEKDTVKAIAHQGLSAKVFGFCRILKEDVDMSLNCDVSGVVCEGPVGVPKLKQFGWTQDEIVTRAVDAVDYAKTHGLYTVFFGVDTTRARLGFLTKLFTHLARQTKIDAIALVDTFGCITPDAMKMLVSKVKASVKLPIEVHTHNDLGLATANTLAAVSAGAEVVHTSVGGLGERSGNASFEEVAVGLRLLSGMKLNLKLNRLYKLSKLVQDFSQMRFPSNKPIVGDHAFTREIGIGIAGWMKYHLGSEPFLPEVVGNRHGVVMGKKSGKHSVEYKLKELGMHATDSQVAEILKAVKRAGERKKSYLTDEEFRRIASRLLKSQRAALAS